MGFDDWQRRIPLFEEEREDDLEGEMEDSEEA